MGSTTDHSKFKETCVLVLKDAKTGRIEAFREIGPNIVTNAGDKYYAECAAGIRGSTVLTPPSRTFNAGMFVVAKSFTVAATKVATFGRFVGLTTTYSGRQLFDSGYPKTADSDTDNTGRTVDAVTYKRTYTTAQANYTIRAIGICRLNATSATSVAGRELLSYKTLSAAQVVTKTSSQTLTAYINHLFTGV